MKNEHTNSTAPLLLGMAAGAALGAAGVMATNTSERQMRRTARKLAKGAEHAVSQLDKISDFNLCSRSAGNNDCPAVKSNQITEEAALNRDVLTNLQLGTAFVENDWYTLQQEVLSIFNFCHLHILCVFYPLAPNTQQTGRCQVLDNIFHK